MDEHKKKVVKKVVATVLAAITVMLTGAIWVTGTPLMSKQIGIITVLTTIGALIYLLYFSIHRPGTRRRC